MRDRRRTHITALASLTALTACAINETASTESEANAAARWETFSTFRQPAEPCTSIESSRVATVRPEQRNQAIARLASVQAIELSDAEATVLTGDTAYVGAATLRPYLVRAVAKYSAPAFFVRTCGATLIVLQGSLGRSTLPSYRMPLVVLLEREPDRVEVLWDIAE